MCRRLLRGVPTRPLRPASGPRGAGGPERLRVKRTRRGVEAADGDARSCHLQALEPRPKLTPPGRAASPGRPPALRPPARSRDGRRHCASRDFLGAPDGNERATRVRQPEPRAPDVSASQGDRPRPQTCALQGRREREDDRHTRHLLAVLCLPVGTCLYQDEFVFPLCSTKCRFRFSGRGMFALPLKVKIRADRREKRQPCR